MSEPIEMSKARNAYAKERDRFRRELQFALRQYGDRPLSFHIKQNIRFIAADLKEDCMNAYHHATKNIGNNQVPLIGSNLRIRAMSNSEEAFSPLNRNKSPNRRMRTQDDDEDIDDFITRNRASGLTGRLWGTGSSDGAPSIPVSKMTFNAHKAASTNTHVLAFEKQLKDDINQMITSIDFLDDKNRANWLTIPKSDRTQYFSSRYDDTSYSVRSYTTPTIGLTGSSKSGGLSSTIDSSSLLSSSQTDSNTSSGSGLTPGDNVKSFYDSYLENLSSSKQDNFSKKESSSVQDSTTVVEQ